MAKAPMNPLAGPAGPGPFSTRTDQLRMGSTSYGEGKETAAIKSGAKLATTPDVRGLPASQVREAAAQKAERLTRLYDPTEYPDQPITSGIALGAGPGPEALAMQSKLAERKLSDILADMLPYDNTGEIAILYQNALSRGN
jgi:hypothetical protein